MPGTYETPVGAWYASRQDLKRTLDFAETAYSNPEIDRVLGSSTQTIDYLLNRTLYPWIGTRTFDFPDLQTSWPWKKYLQPWDLVALTSVTAGGVTIPNNAILLEPWNAGPPYTRFEVDLSTRYALMAAGTYQRAVALTGVWGFSDDQSPRATLSGSIGTTDTTITISDTSDLDAGNVVIIDSERMIVTDRSMVSSGQTLQAPGLAALASGTSVAVTDGTKFARNEIIMIDAEQMRIGQIAGNVLIVKRGWNGSVLAAHTAGATIYAPRQLTVTRAGLGSTVATHSQNAVVNKQIIPAPVVDLCIAESAMRFDGARMGWPRSGEASQVRGMQTMLDAIKDLRDQVNTAFGRKARSRVV